MLLSRLPEPVSPDAADEDSTEGRPSAFRVNLEDVGDWDSSPYDTSCSLEAAIQAHVHDSDDSRKL